MKEDDDEESEEKEKEEEKKEKKNNDNETEATDEILKKKLSMNFSNIKFFYTFRLPPVLI